MRWAAASPLPAAIAGRAMPRGEPAATVTGDPELASLERAVLLNGILVRYLDMMDVYSARDVCHPAENSHVDLTVRPVTLERTADAAKYSPGNRETADHSLPVCVAMGLIDGKVTAARFESGRWRAGDVAAMVKRITVSADPE